ncbi:MAG: hypothetical protein IT454_01180 [Planctomycetes bacterium]|nr:hypothetical protein [Planctomycetota bacterium]
MDSRFDSLRFARVIAIAMAGLALGTSGAAQDLLPAHVSDLRGIALELDAWRELHGSQWRVWLDEQTGYARFLYGGGAQPTFVPREDAQFAALARDMLEATRALHGVDPSQLVDDGVILLPLGTVGSSDKFSVHFHQELHGVAVQGGYVNVLFDRRGTLLSIDSMALPVLGELTTEPVVGASLAREIAAAEFPKDGALAATATSEPELVVAQSLEFGARRARLAWRVRADAAVQGQIAASFTYTVDALDGTIRERQNEIHEFDVSGKVITRATPGLLPAGPNNLEVLLDVPRVRVNVTPFLFVETDQNGDFTIPGVVAPLWVQVVYEGSHCNTINHANNEFILNANLLLNSGNILTMNTGMNDVFTAEANAFLWVNKLRDWVRGNNSSDFTADPPVFANVGLAFLSCNAYAFAGTINFFQAGNCNGGATAPNTSYSTIVAHEFGHVLNDRYLSHNGADGFGEGNADVFAMYLTDQPIIGEDFYSGVGDIRTGLNTRQFWGDTNNCTYGSTPGEVHACGEVLMGALWKVRQRLKDDLGAGGGSATANALFSAWMLGYDETQIKSMIELHWLALDDDDANLSNGTPHFIEIDCGFRAQGFPGVGYQLSTVYVDAANSSGPFMGSSNDPFVKVVDSTCAAGGAPAHVTSGGVISIAAGTYTVGGAYEIGGAAMTLRATGGTAVLR